MRQSATPKRPGPPPLIGGEWLRILIMGALLAGLLFMVFFYQSGTTAPSEPVVETSNDATPVPQLDPQLMATIRDHTRDERLQVTETKAFENLLECSLRVTPAVARKLGMPAQPVPIQKLRQHPDRYRGQYLWYKGELEYLSPPKPGHPVMGYNYYEGRLKTSTQEHVLFAFSVEPRGIKVGDWVRIEGYFFKLRDTYLPVTLTETPMLVGPELLPAYPDWKAVEKLDPAVLAQVKDGTWSESEHRFVNGPDIHKLLDESQGVPLWHLASYVMHSDHAVSAEEWQKIPAFISKDQFEKFRRGEIPRGSPMRLLGTLERARVLPAKVNPLGIESWTEVWLQIRDLGGKTIPLWLPTALSADWRRNQTVSATGYFFKRYEYEAQNGDVRWTPLFVAGSLRHFELSPDSTTNALTYMFAVLVVVVASLFFGMSIRDRKRREEHEAKLVERRRRRRESSAVPQT